MTLPGSGFARDTVAWRGAVLVMLGLGLGGCVLLNLCIGAVPLSPRAMLRALMAGADGSRTSVVIWDLRFPMGLMAAFSGMALGLAGAEMQTVLDNPLASPFTLGLSAAAAFGASLAIVLGWQVPISGLSGDWIVAANAFVFALGSALLLDLLVRLRGASVQTVVLFGIALLFSFQALVAMIQFLASEDALADLVFWTMGSVTRATWPKLGVLAVACAAMLAWSLRDAWALTALRFGEDRAAGLGVDVQRTRLRALLRISILAALAVAFSGTIGFVGLVAPHIGRHLVGEDHRFYLPAAALTGGVILCLSAIAARSLVPGEVLPVGIVTALVGIPFFLAIVLREEG